METLRLKLKKFDSSDLDFLYKLNNDKAVNKYLSYDSVSLERCSEWIDSWKRAYSNTGIFGVYKISLKEDDAPIGLIFIVEREKFAKVELGYRLLPQFWRKGYCTEAAMAVLNRIFLDTDTAAVYAGTHPENTASVSFLLSIGFEEIKNNDTGGGRVFRIVR